MGYHKFRLPFGERTFLECVTATLLDVIEGPVVCVANFESLDLVKQSVQELPDDRIQIVADQRDDSGPLEGIRVGLENGRRSFRVGFREQLRCADDCASGGCKTTKHREFGG